MKETLDNLKPVWNDESEALKEKFQKFFDQKEQQEFAKDIEDGGRIFIKTLFSEGDNGEAMWVQVRNVNLKQKNIVGLLANEPISIKKLKCGSTVKINFKDIMAFVKQ